MSDVSRQTAIAPTGHPEKTPNSRGTTARRAALFAARKAVRSSGKLTATEKHVWLDIACHMDMDGGQAFPSYSTIANNCSRERKTVMKAVDRLEKLGYLIVDRGHKGKSNRYYAAVPIGLAVDDSSPSEEPQGLSLVKNEEAIEAPEPTHPTAPPAGPSSVPAVHEGRAALDVLAGALDDFDRDRLSGEPGRDALERALLKRVANGWPPTLLAEQLNTDGLASARNVPAVLTSRVEALPPSPPDVLMNESFRQELELVRLGIAWGSEDFHALREEVMAVHGMSRDDCDPHELGRHMIAEAERRQQSRLGTVGEAVA